jgi:hypothetical protein
VIDRTSRGFYHGIALFAGSAIAGPLGVSAIPGPLRGAAIPGPPGTVTDDARDLPSAWALGPAATGPAANVSATFALGSDTYRLLRVDAGWHRLDWVRVPPVQAVAIIEQAARQHHDPEVVHLFETAASQLAGLHEGGGFVLLRRQRFGGASSGAPTGPRSTPSSLRPPRLPELEPPSVEEPVFGAEQAAVLREAAASGAPFCEECAREEAERGTQNAA